MALLFVIPLGILDYIRYSTGKLPGELVYELLFINHICFLLFIIPIIAISKNKATVALGTYRHSTILISSWTILMGLILTGVAVLSIWERGSLIMYAIFILLLNFAIVRPHLDRIIFNVLSLFIIGIAIFLFNTTSIEWLVTHLTEAFGVTLPAFAIATYRYNSFIKQLHTKQLLEEKNERIAKEIKNSRRLLLNILPESIADELKENGRVRPQHYSSATIMFIDFVNFSLISKSMTPEKLVEELDSCFTTFDEISEEFNLEKIKTMGDAYICVGGVPTSNTSHPFDTLRAAQRILDFLRQCKEEKLRLQEPYFEARIGINTGPVLAGVVGAKKLTFDIWGDAVNVAARLQTTGSPGRINISESTYLLINHKYQCEPRGKIAIKNAGEINMYFVEERIKQDWSG